MSYAASKEPETGSPLHQEPQNTRYGRSPRGGWTQAKFLDTSPYKVAHSE